MTKPSPELRYQEGDDIGPHETVLLRRTKKVGKRRYGRFICSFCDVIFEAAIRRVAKGEVISCGCIRASQLAAASDDE